MVLPPLLVLRTSDGDLDVESYRQHYLNNLVRTSPHTVWDGSQIKFFPEAFDHAFMRAAGPGDSTRHWDRCRLERMDWILPMLQVLQDPSVDRFVDDRHVDLRGRGARCQVIEHTTPFCVVVKPISDNEMRLVTVMCVDRSTKLGYLSAYQRIIRSDRWE